LPASHLYYNIDSGNNINKQIIKHCSGALFTTQSVMNIMWNV